MQRVKLRFEFITDLNEPIQTFISMSWSPYDVKYMAARSLIDESRLVLQDFVGGIVARRPHHPAARMRSGPA